MESYTVISDPGIDDLVALLLLHTLAPQAKNTLIATFGNAPEAVTSRNAKEFISFVADSWQFLHGSSTPLSGTVERAWPEYFHGPDGVWGMHPPVDTGSLSLIPTYPQNDAVISLGVLTDTLKLVKHRKPATLTIMGGAFTVPGNETPFAETNIAFDPEAAADFFRDCQDMTIRVVPLDVTQKVFWDKQNVAAIPERDEVSIWFKKLLLTWFDRYDPDREKHFTLHDPLAVYLALYPQHATWKPSGIEVITHGDQRGRTILSQTAPTCQIAVDIAHPKKIAEMMYEIIFTRITAGFTQRQ